MLLGSILLAVVWAALNGALTLWTLATGAAIGYAVLWLLAKGGVLPSQFGGKLVELVRLAAFLAYELVIANLRVAAVVMRGHRDIAAGVIGVPLEVTADGEILLLAALINLTPGSVALDVSDDRRTLYVHVMHLGDPDDARRAIKDGFEQRVLRLLR